MRLAPPSDNSILITKERADSPAAMELIAELEAHLTPLYPTESRHGYSVEKLLREGVAFFVTHYNEHRPHRALSLASPKPRRPSVASATGELRVHRRDRLGGVVHEYVLAA